MAAAENDPGWLELQRQREQRMRFEVLHMLHQACEGRTDREINCWPLATRLGVWHAEIFRIIEYLERHGFLAYLGAGPVVRLTPAGVDYVQAEAGRRRTVRD